MNEERFRILIVYSVFVKITSACVIYSFFKTVDWNEGNWQNIAFILFYALERFFAFYFLETGLLLQKKSTVDLAIVAVLTPFHFEEFFLFLKRFKYPTYESVGIFGQGFIISIFSFPIHLMTIYRAFTLSPLDLSTLIAGFLALYSIYFVNLSFFYLYLFQRAQDNYTILNSNAYFRQHFLELSISSLHFFSYVGLFWINSIFLTDFWVYFSTIFIILLTVSYLRIWKKRKSQYPKSKYQMVVFALGFIYKQLLQIDFDQRQLIERNIYTPSMNRYGKYLFDEMLGFSLRLKASLLAVLLANIIGFKIEAEYKIITIVILAQTAISLRIYVSRYQEYTADPPKIIEVFSKLELECLLNQYKNPTKSVKDQEYWENVKVVASKIPSYSPSEIEEFPNILMNAFNGAEIYLNRQNFRKSIHLNKSSNQFIINFGRYTGKQLRSIMTALDENRLVYGIKEMNVEFQVSRFYYILLQELFTRRVHIQLEKEFVPFPADKMVQWYNEYIHDLNLKFVTHAAYSKAILPYLLYNPTLIFYDLHEDSVNP